MVLPVGDERPQEVQVVAKGPTGYRTERYDACVFVKLIGQQGWGEEAPARSDFLTLRGHLVSSRPAHQAMAGRVGT